MGDENAWLLMLPFLTTLEVLRVIQTCKSLRETIITSHLYSESWSLTISTKKPDLLYIHPAIADWQTLQGIVSALFSYDISIDSIKYVNFCTDPIHA
jgi:hypothetical protein